MSAPIPRPAEGDVDNAYKLEISATVTFVAAAIVVGLRFFARIQYARLGWDDYVMMFATIQALVSTIVDFVATHWGLGRHYYFLTPEQRVKQQYYSYIAQIFCVYALTFAKISICLTYIRVVNRVQKRSSKVIRWLCYGIAISVFVVNTIVIITFYAHCMPAEKSWDPSIPGTCWPGLTFIGFILLQGAFSALTDFALCILPTFLLKDLQIERRSKMILCCLMSLGLITGIFAIIRTTESATAIHSPSMDGSYSSIRGLTWAGMERNIAILIGSIPSLHPLAGAFARFTNRSFYKLRSSKTSSINSGEKNGSIGSQFSRGYLHTEDIESSQAAIHHHHIESRQASVTRPSIVEKTAAPIRDHEIV